MTARILIVEDEALVALELRFVLEDLGYVVVGVVADAQAAREMAQMVPVDLALVDIHLSDGPTGIVLGQELGRDFGVTVVFLTANPEMLVSCADGSLGILIKPADDQAVRAAIEHAFNRRKDWAVTHTTSDKRLVG